MCATKSTWRCHFVRCKNRFVSSVNTLCLSSCDIFDDYVAVYSLSLDAYRSVTKDEGIAEKLRIVYHLMDYSFVWQIRRALAYTKWKSEMKKASTMLNVMKTQIKVFYITVFRSFSNQNGVGWCRYITQCFIRNNILLQLYIWSVWHLFNIRFHMYTIK